MNARTLALAVFAFAAIVVTFRAEAQEPERRIAFVVGNETYNDGALPTAANDAGLIAQTLQAAGFEVVGARDLDAETLRQSYVEFQRRLSEAGPGTVAFIYLAGYGLQYGRDNYFVPIGANLAADTDVPISAIRLADLMAPLENLNLKARFFVFDAAYPPPFRMSGPGLPGGLGLLEATPGSLVAYNAAPGTVAPVGKGNYGLYAQALAAELRIGGQAPNEIFDHLRLRVSEESQGAEVPWDSANIDPSFRFFERAPDAPPPVAAADAAMNRTALRTMPPAKAYSAALVRDTPQSYDEFVTAFPSDPLAKRARVLLAARREAVTWQRASLTDSPAAYWTYLRRYPRSPHARMAEFRLRQLSAATAPPQDFTPIDYDIGPPPADELRYLDRPAVDFADAGYDLPPPPRAPDDWIAPMPAAFADLPPPVDSDELFLLPAPAFVPLPAYYNPPRFVVAPRDNRFFAAPDGPGASRGGATLGARGMLDGIHRAPVKALAAGALLVALPLVVQQRASLFQSRGIRNRRDLRAARQQPGGLNGVLRGGPGVRGQPQEQRLPGTGRPLPPQGNGPAGRTGPGANQDDLRRGGPGARPGGLGTNGVGSRPGERNGADRPNGPGSRLPGPTGTGGRPGDLKPGDPKQGDNRPGGKGPLGDKQGASGKPGNGPGAKGREPGVGGPANGGPGNGGLGKKPGNGPGAKGPEPGGGRPVNGGPGNNGLGNKPGGNRLPSDRGPGAGGRPDAGPKPGARPGGNAGQGPGGNAGPKAGAGGGPRENPNRVQGGGQGRDPGGRGRPEQRPNAGGGGGRPNERPAGMPAGGGGMRNGPPGGGGGVPGGGGGMRGGGGGPGGGMPGGGGGIRGGGGAPGGGMPGGGGGMRGGGGGSPGRGMSGGGGGMRGGGSSPGGGAPGGGGSGGRGGPGGGRF